MRIHFIAIGGAIMHNLAIALHKKGYLITGSDDQIFDPAKSRLEKYGLLPTIVGWNPASVTSDLDAVILGMHAKADNPELLQAEKIGVRIYSFPEFIYQESKNKLRIVVAGSHGKTTITSMIMHSLRKCGVSFDYMVGSSVDGFEDSVQLSDAPIIVLEGDEYLTSPIDRRPKFIWYQPNILIISGIAWDHINVFPTFEIYLAQFKQLVDSMQKGVLVYYNGDQWLHQIVGEQFKADLRIKPYESPVYDIVDGQVEIVHESVRYPLDVIGLHNLQNLEGARLVCDEIGIDAGRFLRSVADFKGAGRRLEIISRTSQRVFIRDFAHSPSKLKASTSAVAEQFADYQTIAVFEIHTFSSFNKDFLPQYNGAMNAASVAVVFVNPLTLAKKGNLSFDQEEIRSYFGRNDLYYFDNVIEMLEFLNPLKDEKSAFVFMSSGDFAGLDIRSFIDDK